MILPNKYINIEESYVGLSALILDVLKDKSMTIDQLWASFNKKYKRKMKKMPSLNKFIAVLDYMYLTDVINYNLKGEMFNENI